MEAPVKTTTPAKPTESEAAPAAERDRMASEAVTSRAADEHHENANLSLSELDDALASNLDDALQGNFESIDAVLDGVFEEQAVLVQNVDGSPVQSNAPRVPADPPQAKHDAAEQGNSHTETDLAQAETDVVKQVEAQPVAAAEQSPSPIERAAIPMPAPEPAATVAKIETPSPEVAAVPLTAAPETAAPRVAAVPPAARMKLPSLNILAPIKNALAIINAPLAMLPQAMRPMVDWVALTLLAWVPIVWVMVLLNGGSHAAGADSHADASAEASAESHAESHEAGPAPLHEESHAVTPEEHGH